MSDILRFVVLALAAFDLGGIAAVAWIHYKAWRLAPKGMGILPFHVWTIAVAHGGLAGMLLVSVMGNLRAPTISPRVYVYIVCLILTAVALVAIGIFQRRRVQVATTSVVRETNVTQIKE